MNLNNSVTHCVAAESKGVYRSLYQVFSNAWFSIFPILIKVLSNLFSGIKYQAAKNRGDLIQYTWVLDCCEQKKLIPLQPKLIQATTECLIFTVLINTHLFGITVFSCKSFEFQCLSDCVFSFVKALYVPF